MRSHSLERARSSEQRATGSGALVLADRRPRGVESPQPGAGSVLGAAWGGRGVEKNAVLSVGAGGGLCGGESGESRARGGHLFWNAGLVLADG